MVCMQIILTDAQAASLRRLATRRVVTEDVLVREALQRLIDETTRRRVRRARQSMGAFDSGYHDTSAHHDAALDQLYSD
jgi:hypothetical protein